MASELNQILRDLDREGFTAKRTKGGHWRITWKGEYVATFAGTVSDPRGNKNALADVRRFKRAKGLP